MVNFIEINACQCPPISKQKHHRGGKSAQIEWVLGLRGALPAKKQFLSVTGLDSFIPYFNEDCLT
jgi:hypothetical protein